MLISECAESQPVITKNPLMATSSFHQSSRLSKREVSRKTAGIPVLWEGGLFELEAEAW